MQHNSFSRCGPVGRGYLALVGGAGLLALLAGGLGGCASASSTPISLDRQGQGQLIECSGYRLSTTDCIRLANELCENDYEVIASTGRSRIGSGAASVLDDMDRAMIVRCRGADG